MSNTKVEKQLCVNDYSEPEKGTISKIYLPRHNIDQTINIRRKRAAEIPIGNGETVLVVEDEPALLTLLKVMLGNLGYQVLVAGMPDKAIKLAEEHAGEIRLILTDVVMPEMNGLELAERMQSLYPGMKILFMSGYTANTIFHNGALDAGMNFIQKPFSMQDLAVKVMDLVREK